MIRNPKTTSKHISPRFLFLGGLAVVVAFILAMVFLPHLTKPSAPFRSQDPSTQTTASSIKKGEAVPTPSQTVKFQPKIIQIACGEFVSLILKSDGSLWASGSNRFGKLGLEEMKGTTNWLLIGKEIKAVSPDMLHTLALKLDGSVLGAGLNDFGQLGIKGWFKPREARQWKTLISDANKISSGLRQSLILKKDGSVWGTGIAISMGGSKKEASHSSIWRPLFSTEDVKETEPKTKKRNRRSQKPEPPPVFTEMDSGTFFSFLIRQDGVLLGRGLNYDGQLGKNDFIPSDKWLPLFSDIKKVVSGIGHALVLRSDGSLWGTGWNELGQLGLGHTQNVVQWVKILTDITDIQTGWAHSLAIKIDGSLWITGHNGYGQLGVGTTTDSSQWVNVMDDVVQASGGRDHSLILKKDGTLWATGNGERGQFGIGENTSTLTWIQILPKPKPRPIKDLI